MKFRSRHSSTKKDFYDFFTVPLQLFIKYHSSPLFSVTQHHGKRWEPPTPYAWRNYWTVPIRNTPVRGNGKQELLFIFISHENLTWILRSTEKFATPVCKLNACKEVLDSWVLNNLLILIDEIFLEMWTKT